MKKSITNKDDKFVSFGILTCMRLLEQRLASFLLLTFLFCGLELFPFLQKGRTNPRL